MLGLELEKQIKTNKKYNIIELLNTGIFNTELDGFLTVYCESEDRITQAYINKIYRFTNQHNTKFSSIVGKDLLYTLAETNARL